MHWDLFWSAVEAVATVIGAAAAVVGAVIAFRSLWAIKADSADRSRPVVIAEIVIPPLGDHQMNLELSNQADLRLGTSGYFVPVSSCCPTTHGLRSWRTTSCAVTPTPSRCSPWAPN